MDRDVRPVEPDGGQYTVTVNVRNPKEMRDWITKNVPEKFFPKLTQWEMTRGVWVVRATFNTKHYASLFKLFFCDG